VSVLLKGTEGDKMPLEKGENRKWRIARESDNGRWMSAALSIKLKDPKSTSNQNPNESR
jgi:hypothetical protein